MSGLILPYTGIVPRIDPTAFIAETATVIGDVEVGADASLWYGTVLRGDVNDIRIGARTNIQDGTIIHVSTKVSGAYIGDDALVGHCCLLHACRIEAHAFIGMQACVMDLAVVETDAMVAAGALVTPGKRVPSGELWAGRPASFKRKLSPEELESHRKQVAHYVDLARRYREERQ